MAWGKNLKGVLKNIVKPFVSTQWKCDSTLGTSKMTKNELLWSVSTVMTKVVNGACMHRMRR